LVPVGEESLSWVRRYLDHARPVILAGRQADALFRHLTRSVHDRQAFWYLIRRYARQAGIRKGISPHTLRHASPRICSITAPTCGCAVAVGHADISTTQIYTHIARERLKQLHAKHHPRG
jgi:integrase/recombinase XerD